MRPGRRFNLSGGAMSSLIGGADGSWMYSCMVPLAAGGVVLIWVIRIARAVFKFVNRDMGEMD